MRNKAVLFAFLVLLLPLFLLIHPSTEAQEIRSISYAAITQRAKDEPPNVPVKLMIPTAKNLSNYRTCRSQK